MSRNIVVLVGTQFFKKTFSTKGFLILLGVFIMVLCYVSINSWNAYKTRHHAIKEHQVKARESWENNPDKHPHRMAHFGTFVFRQQHPLSIFDSGIESYTGNAIFLEAHRQNTANFSEASLQTGLVRFGDFSIALLLQLILPLIIFFIGYAAISEEKEKSILKISYLQGAEMKEILLGKTVGLFLISSLFFIPSFLALWGISYLENQTTYNEIIIRTLCITVSYLLFFMILCGITVVVSAQSKNSSKALLSLLGIWLLFFIIIPKMAQTVGNYWYPNLSKIEFKAAVEAEVSKKGDSHDSNDPYFKQLRDSVLKVHKVKDVKELPFNYGGFIMSKGEAQTAEIYKKQYEKLIESYRNQNSITQNLVVFNPFLAVKKISMSLAGTDFDTYVNFLDQTEQYRYKQSQQMNALQMKFISNKAKGSEGKTHVVDKTYWKSFPDFTYQYIPIFQILSKNLLSVISLLFWMLVIILVITRFSNRFKII